MLTVTKTVFYCEHCKRHRLTRNAIEKHEPRCIYNPQRSACGWHSNPIFQPPSPADFTAALKDNLDPDWLRDKMDGCPACMLAVVVQAQLSLDERDALEFGYDREVERFRNEERRDDW